MTTPTFEILGLSPAGLARLAEAIPGLHGWYRAAARDLPWRRTRDPYAIWVSEAMLQQTRVATVVPYYHRWMAAFPTVKALAEAEEGGVLKLWEGLGYYSRARNLHRAAREVIGRFSGRVPADPEDFRGLPGVGKYTAAAVLSIAFDADLPVIDGNVFRVLARLLALDGNPRRPPFTAALEQLAGHLLQRGAAALHNQALMELGALVCTPRSPSCDSCPLSGVCQARVSERAEDYPKRSPRKAVPHHDVSIAVVLRDGRVLIDQRPYGGLLGGLWEFPGGKVAAGETAEQALQRELFEELGLAVQPIEALAPVHHAYTHLKVTLHPYVCRFESMDPRVGEGRPYRWVTPPELDRYAMPRANRKVIEALESWFATQGARRKP